jgi:hypothetical protein
MLIWSDGFTRADGDTVGNGWVERGADFDISGNTLISDGAAQVASCYNAIPTSADQEVEVRFRTAGSDLTFCNVALARRANEGASGYTGYMASARTSVSGDGQVRLYRVDAGESYTQLGSDYSTPVLPNTDYTIKLSVLGTALAVSWEGVANVVTATDATYSAVGDIGVANYFTNVDWVNVYDFLASAHGVHRQLTRAQARGRMGQ